MSGYVSQDVVSAIVAGETVITRRIEIYEADGVTRWSGDNGLSRVKSGQVGVDSTRDERRNLDVVLDNSDSMMVHDPVTGLWYDKIVKAFRGIKYQNLNRNPSVAVLNLSSSTVSPITTMLRRIGFNNFTYFPDLSIVSTDILLNYDIIVAYGATVDFDAATISLLGSAYILGANILTMNNHATSASVPLISSTATRTGTTAWNIDLPLQDNEFASDLIPYLNPGINNETIPLTIRATARAAAITTYAAATDYAAIYEQGQTGGRWFHYHPSLNLSYTPVQNVAKELAFLQAAVNWLYSYGEQRAWETQIGEFMIDKIVESSFPHEIAITGRDYVKRLARIKLDIATSWASGTSVDTLVTSLGVLAGLKKFRINSQGAKLTALQSFDRTTDYWAVIKQVCDSVNIEVFFDAAGYLVVRPYLDPSTSPISIDLVAGGANGNVATFKRTSDDTAMYNRVVVTGTSPDQTTNDGIKYQAIAENRTPSSPTRIERLGAITYYYASEFFTNIQQCQDYANRLLSVMALESYSFDFESLVMPWIEAGEICRVPNRDQTRTPEKYLMSSFTIPLGLGTMSGSAKRVTIIDPIQINGLQPYALPRPAVVY